MDPGGPCLYATGGTLSYRWCPGLRHSGHVGTWRPAAQSTCPWSPLLSAPSPGRPSRKQAPTGLLFQFSKKKLDIPILHDSFHFFLLNSGSLPQLFADNCRLRVRNLHDADSRMLFTVPPPPARTKPSCPALSWAHHAQGAPSGLRCPLALTPATAPRPPSYRMKCQT